MKLTSLFLCGVLALVCSTATAGYWRADLLKQSVPNIRLHKLGTYESGLIDESAAEIVAYDKRSQRLFVTNAKDQSVDVLSIRNPRKPYKLFALDLTPYGEPNSVAVSKGIVAVAAAADEVDVTGKVVFFNRNLAADSNACGSPWNPRVKICMDGISRKMRRRCPYAHTFGLSLVTIREHTLLPRYEPNYAILY